MPSQPSVASKWPGMDMHPPDHPGVLTNNQLRQKAETWLSNGTPAMVVHVADIQGSTPRATDARMLVSLTQVLGTIGGGHLEWQAVSVTRQALGEYARPGESTDARLPSWRQRFALGPTLGQCCGGAVVLDFFPLTAASLEDWPVSPPRFHLDLHGAGHVGQAIVQLLNGIDCRVRWIDQRLDERLTSYVADEGCPPAHQQVGVPSAQSLAMLAAHIQPLFTDDAVDVVQSAPWGSLHLVITHRHDLDLAIVDALMRRDDIREGRGWIGLIGSRSKRAAFEHRLQARGHAQALIDRLACPIGLPGIEGKSPAVIAIAVVAQLLQLSSQHTD